MMDGQVATVGEDSYLSLWKIPEFDHKGSNEVRAARRCCQRRARARKWG